jgi:succinate dehydrogenase flavin-adding protein (antitoxin of CptAB toxin-antitoxin module)
MMLGGEKGELMKIDELEFSVRTYNCLKRARIDTVEKLLTMSDADLMKIRCFGEKCLIEVHEKIRKPYGVTITPAVPGPSEADPNIMELCFHNGERNMKEKMLAKLAELLEGLDYHKAVFICKCLEDL